MDCRTIVTFDAKAGNPLEMKSLLQQELFRRGVLWGGFHNMSYAHTDNDIALALDAYRDALPVLREAVAAKAVHERLRGEPLEPVFRRTGNFNMKPKRKG